MIRIGMTGKEFDELAEAVRPLLDLYQINKIEPCVVSTFDCDEGGYNFNNLFDIYKDKIVCHADFMEKDIVKEALPIIKNIQSKLKEYSKE